VITTYEWTPGRGHKVDANVLAREVDRLKRKHGVCNARDLLEAARPVESPIHDLCEWDDERAADEHRVYQLRKAMSSLRVVRIDHPQPEPALVHVTRVTPKTVTDGYVGVRDAMADPEFRAQVVRDALRQVGGLLNRYAFIPELDAVRETFDACPTEPELRVRRAA
jgi:hypothetical protein